MVTGTPHRWDSLFFLSRGSRALRTVEAGLAERSSLPYPIISKPLAGAPGLGGGAGSQKPEPYWGKSHKALVSSIMCYFTTRFLDIIGKRLYTKGGNLNRTGIWSCPLSSVNDIRASRPAWRENKTKLDRNIDSIWFSKKSVTYVVVSRRPRKARIFIVL